MINFSSPEFIKELKARDHSAISSLIRKYHDGLIYGALKQGLGADQAEEVVQETWSTFFEKVENFKGNSHIRTYLFGIMYNKTKELWRSNKKYTHDYDENSLDRLFQVDGHYHKAPKDPTDWIISKETSQILVQEIEKLPENQRMAFNLKEIQGEKTSDICNIMNISSTNLGVLIYRAKTNLRLVLEKRLEGDDS